MFKLRDLKNLPVFTENHGQLLGRVDHGILNDRMDLEYLVLFTLSGERQLLGQADFILLFDAVKVPSADVVKSYRHGEELSISELKIGDRVFDGEGLEIGTISDFILNPAAKKAWAAEIEGGWIRDWLYGRKLVELNRLRFVNSRYAFIES